MQFEYGLWAVIDVCSPYDLLTAQSPFSHYSRMLRGRMQILLLLLLLLWSSLLLFIMFYNTLET